MRRLFACVVALLLLGGGLLLLAAGGGPAKARVVSDPPPTSTPTPTTSASPTATSTPTPSSTATPCNAQAAVTSYLADRGFDPSDVSFDVDWSKMSTANAGGALSPTPLRSEQDVQTFLQGGGAKVEAVQRLLAGLDLSVAELVPVQFRTPIYYSGNWYWDGDKLVAGGQKQALAGDVWLLAVPNAECSVNATLSIRSVCGNVGFDTLMPWAKE